MVYNRPIVLTFAGFDPCGGAGILADIKTLEQCRCLGFGVITALTRQTEDRFEAVEWLSFDTIIGAAEPLFRQYHVAAVKIGIVRDLPLLLQLVRWVKQQSPSVPVVWDTVLASSTGFDFVNAIEQATVAQLLREVTVATPNLPEVLRLADEPDMERALAWLLRQTTGALLVKGGHALREPGVDYLYTGNDVVAIPTASGVLPAKHGSGCILSAAIAGGMAQGLGIAEACRQAKVYVEGILTSNTGLLAYHYV